MQVLENGDETGHEKPKLMDMSSSIQQYYG